ncbi:putative transposase YbfD/YdcC [Rhodopirellula rubra]|uniref:Putative transposase YbfD/YdcC n=1 Tax=Aporhodopirellula rubra TaxID=980271 RepID=A0A7W5DZL3_9BACT|nr:putative transposase YbfD/YdcC [Aporhodopirellula rubra]
MAFIDVRSTINTLDAIGAQKSIAEKTHCNGGHIFAIKDSHPKLANAIREHCESAHEEGLKANGVNSKKTVGKKRGRQ